jgi:hypothetical protein
MHTRVGSPTNTLSWTGVPMKGHLILTCEFSYDSTREGIILFVSAFFQNTVPAIHSVMQYSERLV